MVENKQLTPLNNYPEIDGKCVFYRMQAAQRVEFNHALEYAIGWANVTKKPLIIRRIVEVIER